MIAGKLPYGKASGHIGLQLLFIAILLGLAVLGLLELGKIEAAKPHIIIHTESEASTTPVSTVY